MGSRGEEKGNTRLKGRRVVGVKYGCPAYWRQEKLLIDMGIGKTTHV